MYVSAGKTNKHHEAETPPPPLGPRELRVSLRPSSLFGPAPGSWLIEERGSLPFPSSPPGLFGFSCSALYQHLWRRRG